MKYTSVLVNKNENIGIITLNRPEFNNTFNVPLANELNKSLIEFENDPSVNVVIINASGKNFCTGIDVNDLEGKSNVEYLKWVELMEKMNITIANMGKPVIASVQKIAVANGIGLVAACDLAIAAENAKFGATAINVGLFCMGPAVPLSKSLGRKKTLELILMGEMIDAFEAKRIGLINKVVPTEKLEEETLKYARKLALKSPLALQIGKKSFYKMEDLDFEKALDLSNNHFATLCTTEDAHEGVDAFLNKRDPIWKNR
ncbi:enoyl-CoA hydratase/isomerase family protein [Helicovermis profundi]|uniref:Enoyl-CoA hydratase domain-containing protein 3, mitochondrial n=1 Tax=Helicovermis profundi TaxID=3065157 RepID=A0AAU9EDA5_9FIRM|nr:enoyl-CoA hydratase [Clostridia bacterium S502]